MTTSGPHARDVFSGSSEMARRMREFDWSTTPLGAVASWPQSLRSAVSICIGSRFPIAIYWGPSLTLLYNDAWSPILGMKHPWALGQGAREVWPEIWTDIGPLFEQVMSTGESTYSEDALLPMYRHGYTEECYFNFTFTPVHGEGGRIEGVFNAVIETTFRVVSERRTRLLTRLGHRIAETRSAQAACALAAEALASATEDVPFCALYLVEPDGRSAKLAGQAGLPADRGLTENVRLGEDRQTWPLDRVQAGGGVLLVDDLERRLGFSPPGGKWPEPANAALIAPLVTGGQTAGFLILGVNPRRAVDEECRQFAQQAALSIAAVVGNAIAFDAQRRRVEALAEIDRVKTAFFSNVSHEFRTPLTLMLGPQEDALASPGGTLSGEALRAVHRNTLRLLKLVNTLLDFSRIEAGRAQVSFQPTDLAGLTKDLASSFRSAVDRGGLTYQVDCPPLPEPVYVDRDMWEKIVLNLLSNAFKFTLEGEIRVSLRAEGAAVALRVADTGVGIPSDEVPRVFERFHRIEGSRARTHEGSGIGLALVHDLVKLHGGRIEVASQEGKGTTFTVVLPRGRAHLPADRVTPPAAQPALPGVGAEAFVQEALRWETAPSTPSLAPVTHPGHERILIADDNADMREYLVRLLRERWLVDEVSDGVQALEQARRNPPDLILTDIMMPNLGGFGLLRELRADPRIASIPVIMLSARAGEEARIEGLQAGADDYLPKPFSARELIARVATHLQLARMRKVAEADRQRLYDLFEQAPVGIIVYEGPDLRISFQNATSRQIFNRPDARGKPFVDVFPRMADSPAYESLRRVWNGGPPESMPEMMFLVPKDGGEMEERYFTAHHQPLHDGSGAIVGVIAIGYDVSHERKLRREAQDANRAKDEFLAMLGHELRNPLSPMVTSLQLMRLRGSDLREQAVLERQVGHLIRLVDDLLDISRVTRGKIELRKSRIELAEVVLRGIEMATPLLEQRRQHTDVQVAPLGLAVEGDRDRLAQVVSNLLTNASKYSEPETTIHIAAETVGERVRLRVRDEGIGMPPEMLERAFDLFFQQPQAIDRAKGGLGLGLTIVRSLVELHGGTVVASSAGPGQGSEFVVELPLAAEAGAVSSASTAAPSVRIPLNDLSSGGGTRVLVVDDNLDVAESIAELLREMGWQVQLAGDGPEALRVAARFRPEVCLVDIGLPVMDGYELAQKLRAAGSLAPGARLIAVTGYGQDSDRARSREAGFDLHLVKPVKSEVLIEAVGAYRRP